MRSRLAAAQLALLAVLAAGCERGCLTTWFTEKTKPEGTAKGSFPLNAVDCADGVARCVDRTIQVSRAYSYSYPCKSTPERCVCPWDDVVTCARGCAAEGVEVVLPRERASAVLCAPATIAAFTRPPPPSVEVPAALCEDARFVCWSGVVSRCASDPGEPPVPLATCAKGCAPEIASLDEDRIPNDAAVAILCAH